MNIEFATEQDLPQLVDLLSELFALESDFKPDRDKQLRGLRLILDEPALGKLFVLRVDGQEAGYAELDRSEPGEVRLMYFGLMPGFIGRGLGRWFLRWAVARAWSYAPGRVWVDTCTLDHPRALGNYEAAGFRRYGERVKEFEIPW